MSREDIYADCEDPPWTPWTWLVGRGNCYHKTSPALLLHRVRHRLTGPRRGCSCSRCFRHPRRRVPAAEFNHLQARLSALELEMREMRRRQRAQIHP